MNADSRNSDPVDRALAASDRLGTCLAEATALLAELRDNLTLGIQCPIEPPLKPPLTRDEIYAAYRRNHRPGVPSKIASDPQLQTFVPDRVDTLSFQEIVAAIGWAFPPDRRVSVSSLHRWWLRTGKALAAARP